ncbi:hypothetical protein NQZ71_14760 [Niallia taxi]|uniref:hypothetical protein n=1 Tax=Niallia taxi TaxID=2499688 RepID=UPI0021A441E0|nr:hypothetical protein [Niallia taxi]MCT2343998.1 hypothetical protein [Niallia taxi]MDE5051522.1 hypothetical protein [Niallia taxi]MED3964786.1 hypothetical protein [Niallia taxi]WOD62048.1 hypothetical protein NQZ71_14760 [Niallia taxi]
MVNFLLVFSIALNILALLCIALLFIRQNRLAAFESRQEKALEEMEEIVSSFIAEIKEENELFLDRVQRLDSNLEESKKEEPRSTLEVNEPKPIPMINTYKAAAKSYQTFEKSTGNDDVEELLDLILPQIPEEDNKEKAVQEENVAEAIVEKEEEPEEKEKTLLEVVTELEEQGKTIEEIAKQLNKGKTEIELLLKFRQNNHE